MNLKHVIQKYGSLYEIQARDKSSFFAEISKYLAKKAKGPDAEEIETILRERELIECTALGPGIALPHGKCQEIQKPICCFAVSREGVDFGAADGGLTHVFFAILTPAANNGAHLSTLAEVSMIMSDPDLRQSILDAEDKQDVIETIESGTILPPAAGCGDKNMKGSG